MTTHRLQQLTSRHAPRTTPFRLIHFRIESKDSAMPEIIQIVTTTDRKDLAERIGRTLVDRRLAACTQIVGPILSIYRWQGATESAEEWQCWIKTSRERYAAVEQAIRELHTYAVPEILAIPVVAGNPAYLLWLEEHVADSSSHTQE
jgi:periplasmic divalent cation tolerance protein